MEEKTIVNRVIYVFDFKKEKWVKTDFEKLEPGNIFKIVDGDERYTNWETGDNVWVAQGLPYLNADGVLSIKTAY